MQSTSNHRVAGRDRGVLRTAGGEVGAREGRTRCVLAHLSVFVNLFTGVLGPVVALLLWYTGRKRSRVAARNAMRAFWNQVVWGLLVFPVGSLLTLSLALFLPVPEAHIPALTLVVALAWASVPFVEGTWAALRARRGEDYRYLLDRLTGGAKAGRTKNKATIYLTHQNLV